MIKRGQKKGQITIFIIIIVILLAGIAITFFIISRPQLPEKVPLEVVEVDAAIADCVNQRAIDAIRIIGLQGGYLQPEDFLDIEVSKIAYGLSNKINVLVSRETMENEISLYLKATLPVCIIPGQFPEFNITQKPATAKTNIQQDSIIVTAKSPISAQKGIDSFTIDREYETEIPIRLGRIHDTAIGIVEKYKTNPEETDITFLTDLEFETIFVPYSDDVLIYTIVDEQSEIEDIPYSFTFVVDFSL